MSATLRLQRSAAPDEIWPRLSAEARRFPEPAQRAFREALHVWAKAMWTDETGAEAAFPSFEELEQEKQEMATILQARWANLRAAERESGRELGRADERIRLRRQAALKFGLGATDRLADHLAGLTTREDLDRVGDWIIECESGDELLLRLQSIASV